MFIGKYLGLNTLKLFFLVSVLSACAPGLGSSLKVSMIGDSEVASLKKELDGVGAKVNVLKFQDAREIEAIAQIDGRLIKPDSEVGVTVQRAFESYMRDSGVQLSLFNCPSLRGEIKKWTVFVAPGFPSSNLEAEAEIVVELLDTKEKVVHKSQYSGNFSKQTPFMKESTVSEALGTAMSYAIKEALQDPIFINMLSTLQGRN